MSDYRTDPNAPRTGYRGDRPPVGSTNPAVTPREGVSASVIAGVAIAAVIILLAVAWSMRGGDVAPTTTEGATTTQPLTTGTDGATAPATTAPATPDATTADPVTPTTPDATTGSTGTTTGAGQGGTDAGSSTTQPTATQPTTTAP